MPTALFPGKKEGVQIPTPSTGRLSVRDLRKSLRLPGGQYRIVRQTGNTPQTMKDGEMIGENEVVRVVPQFKQG